MELEDPELLDVRVRTERPWTVHLFSLYFILLSISLYLRHKLTHVHKQTHINVNIPTNTLSLTTRSHISLSSSHTPSLLFLSHSCFLLIALLGNRRGTVPQIAGRHRDTRLTRQSPRSRENIGKRNITYSRCTDVLCGRLSSDVVFWCVG